MATIKLKSGEQFQIDNEWAQKVLADKTDPVMKMSDMIEVMPGRYEPKSAIASVNLTGGNVVAEHDLKDPQVRAMLKKIEAELEAITAADPEKKGYAFDFWCVEKGYYTRPQVVRNYYSGAFGGPARWYKKVDNYSFGPKANEVPGLKRALDTLIGQRLFMQKQEHQAELGSLQLKECKLDEKNPCKFCYPNYLYKKRIKPTEVIKRMPKVEDLPA